MSYTIVKGTEYVKFVRGTSEAWENLDNSLKSPDTLYFISDKDEATGKLYLGTKQIGGSGASSTNIKDLEDIIIGEGVSEGSLLVYNSESKKWEAKSVADAIENVVGVMTAPTDTLDGTSGLVPQPKVGDNDLFLKGDGTWANPLADLSPVVSEVIKQITEGADEKFDTLKEISEWIIAHDSVESVVELSNKVGDLDKILNDQENEDGTKTEGLVSKVSTLDSEVSELDKLLNDETTGLVPVVSSLQTDVDTLKDKVEELDERMIWSSIEEEENIGG